MRRYGTEALGQLCDVSIGRTPRRSEPRYWGGPHPWATIRDLDGGTLVSTGEGITDAALHEVMPKVVEPNTLLFSFKLSIGRMAFAGRAMHHNEAIAALPIRDPNVLDREFLFYALRANTHEGAANHAVMGKVLNKRKVEQIEIPLPPLNEQRRMVAILNRVAKIERLRAGAAERLREFVPALFVKMFGDPVENPMGWHMAKLAALGTLDRGRSRHRPRNSPQLYDGAYPFVQTGDVANAEGLIRRASQSYSELGLRQSKMWPEGTLCITIAANIGKTGILAFDACFPDSVVGFLPGDTVTVEYVQSALDQMQTRIEEAAPMAAQRNINLRILRELRIPVPPIALQRRFAEAVQFLRDTEELGRAGGRVASLLTDSLMERLLSGVAEH